MPRKVPDASRVVSVRLPDDLLQRLDRYLDWSAPQRRLQSTRNAAIREALSAWLDHQEQLAGLLQPHTLRRQFQATYTSIRHHHDGVPISRLRQLLQWPRERFDAVLEALRADQQVELEALKDNDRAAQASPDGYHVHGQLYVRIRWRE
jgi:metal-responsive CopG/Arc/MetJ family transcriptional regulator